MTLNKTPNGNYYEAKSGEETDLLKKIESRSDTEAIRMQRYLAMPDLSRTETSPIHEIVSRILSQKDFENFDVIKVPELVSTHVTFDLYNFAPDHPARSKSDTYFIDEKNILRPHTTVMWYYYLSQPEVKEKMARGEAVGFFSFGKVYRKDEIDRNHMNVFHQMDGGFLIPKSKKIIGIEDLQNVLADIAKAVFGPDIKYRFNKDTFPYTDPSLEMEVEIAGRWIEVLGCGIMTDTIIKNLGLDPEKWSNWAFGFGLERLAIISMDLPDIRLLWSEDERVIKQLKLGQKFIEVSKYPPIVRDISFIVPKTFVPNDYFDLVRENAPDLVEQVALLDKYENDEKFGKENISYAFRITYRSLDRTLTSEEIDTIHKKVESETAKIFDAKIR
jgi:phenylalanyl-tRNA synthetase alpha chain